MDTYRVTQTLVKTRIVRVRARSKAEANELAQKGHGEQISPAREPYRLLTSEAVRLARPVVRDTVARA